MDQSILDQYLKSLSEKEMKAYLIAKSHLGMSFTLEKSTGFLDWYRGTKVPLEPLLSVK
jgi:hypothetical protein